MLKMLKEISESGDRHWFLNRIQERLPSHGVNIQTANSNLALMRNNVKR